MGEQAITITRLSSTEDVNTTESNLNEKAKLVNNIREEIKQFFKEISLWMTQVQFFIADIIRVLTE